MPICDGILRRYIATVAENSVHDPVNSRKMSYIWVMILATLGLTPVISHPIFTDALAKHHHRDGHKTDSDWDHYIFVEQYPAGICYYNKTMGDGIMCNYTSNTSLWTIHGLWPTLEDTKGPNYCNRSALFNLDFIRDLIPRLNRDWANLIFRSVYGSFWEHEWLKHGTCSGIPTQHTYFTTVLDIFEDHQFGDILKNYGLVPRVEPYDIEDILDAIQKDLGAYPYSVDCRYSEETGQVLTEIGICLDKNSMKVISCPSPTLNNCNRLSSVVHYPNSPNSIAARNTGL